MELILGLDASTQYVGWCMGYDQVIDSGLFIPTGKDVWQRIRNYSVWLEGFFLIQGYMGDYISTVIYEKPSGNRGNMDTNLKLGALLFATWLCCDENGVAFVKVSPSQVKKTGVYKGQLEKASEISGKEFKVITKKDGSVNQAAMDRQNDMIDAIGVWLAGLEKLKGKK